MNKRFFQQHIVNVFAQIFFIGLSGVCLYVGISSIIVNNWRGSAIGFLAFILLFGLLADELLIYNIHFCEEMISTRGHTLLLKKQKSQLKTIVLYADIDDVKMIFSHNNSKNKPIPSALKAPSIFFEFSLKNGRKARFLISGHSKKQRRDMIAIINAKTGLSLDYDVLEGQLIRKKKKKCK